MTITKIDLMKVAQEFGTWSEPKDDSKEELKRCHEANTALMASMVAIFNLGCRTITRNLGTVLIKNQKNQLIK